MVILVQAPHHLLQSQVVTHTHTAESDARQRMLESAGHGACYHICLRAEPACVSLAHASSWRVSHTYTQTQTRDRVAHACLFSRRLLQTQTQTRRPGAYMRFLLKSIASVAAPVHHVLHLCQVRQLPPDLGSTTTGLKTQTQRRRIQSQILRIRIQSQRLNGCVINHHHGSAEAEARASDRGAKEHPNAGFRAQG